MLYSHQQPAFSQLSPSAVDAILGFVLESSPFYEFRNSALKCDRRLPAEQGFGFSDVGETMTNIAAAEFSEDFRFDVRFHFSRQGLGDLKNRHGLSGANIDRFSGNRVFGGRYDRSGNVLH